MQLKTQNRPRSKVLRCGLRSYRTSRIIFLPELQSAPHDEPRLARARPDCPRASDNKLPRVWRLTHRLLTATRQHLPGHYNCPRLGFSDSQKLFKLLMCSTLCCASNVLWHFGPFEGEFLSNQWPPKFGVQLSGVTGWDGALSIKSAAVYTTVKHWSLITLSIDINCFSWMRVLSMVQT